MGKQITPAERILRIKKEIGKLDTQLRAMSGTWQAVENTAKAYDAMSNVQHHLEWEEGRQARLAETQAQWEETRANIVTCSACGEEFLTEAELEAHLTVKPIFHATGTHQTLREYEASLFGGDMVDDEPNPEGYAPYGYYDYANDLPTEEMLQNWNEANDYTHEGDDDLRGDWEAEQYQSQFDD
jgi:hypothetical protein